MDLISRVRLFYGENEGESLASMDEDADFMSVAFLYLIMASMEHSP